MSPKRVRQALAVYVVAITAGLGAAANAHLPAYVYLKTGNETLRVQTFGATVAAAVKDSGVAVDEHDRVVPAPSTRLAGGMTIEIRRAFLVRLLADGRTRVFHTAARSVREFVAEAAVALRSTDRVYPAPDASLWPGAMVRIVRIATRIVTVEERLPFASLTRADSTMPVGLTRVVREGQPGVRVRRVAETMADGVLAERREISSAVVRPPLERILHVGTRRELAARGEFAGREVLHMEATAYAPWHGRGVDGTTAIGLRAGYGVVAVDPSIIPLRSVLYIEGYGQAVAGDTGGAIKGRRIDLGFNSAQDAYRFGRRPVRVYVLSSPASPR